MVDESSNVPFFPRHAKKKSTFNFLHNQLIFFYKYPKYVQQENEMTPDLIFYDL